MRFLIFILLLFSNLIVSGQGYNHQWLLGSYNFLQDPKGRIFYDQNSYTLMNENRKMPFKGTQGNISDKNGNLLMSSNGIWIANALNDTMMNGSGLNPGGVTSGWPFGLPMVANNLFIPYPADTSKYILFHHSASNYNGITFPVNHFYQTQIDLTLDNGFGGVILKNNLIIYDTLNGGIGACKHSNGRDWWIVIHKDSSDVIFKILVTDTGISSIATQQLNYSPLPWGNFAQLSFSRDGTKFCTNTYDPATLNSYVILCDFDRCTGIFSNTEIVQITNNAYLFGLAFSPSGKYVYTCSSNFIYQIDSDSLTVDTVAVYDGFISPGPTCCETSFWNMYLAANGKIYLTSGSSTQHLHEINYPDSAGLACDVQQHAIGLNYVQLRSVPNHPNYYLGCDTTLGCPCLIPPVGVDEISNEFNLNLYPNPTTNKQFNISYLLPQNKEGKLEIYDITGKIVYEMRLPQWSTLQNISLPNDISNGLYNCVITCDIFRTSKKLSVIKD